MGVMSLIRSLTDRILFAVGLLLFMQVPQFVDQYTQRLGGYLQGQQEQLSRYQSIADHQFSGNLSSLIDDFNVSDKSSVREVGGNINRLAEQIEVMKIDLQVLEQGPFVAKLTHLLLNMKVDVANETIRVYSPGIPISLEGVICGLLGGILLSLIFHWLMKLLSYRMRPFKATSRPAEKRVEPRI